MRCPGCQQENRPGAKFCDECGTLLQRLDGTAPPAPSYADLQYSLTEALEQQTATAEVLRIISQSPTDVRPVFSAILANALRLCGADQGGVFTFDGHAFRVAAISGKVTPEFREGLASGPIPPGRDAGVQARDMRSVTGPEPGAADGDRAEP